MRDALVARHPALAPLVGEDVAFALPAGALVEYDLDLPEPLIARATTVALPAGAPAPSSAPRPGPRPGPHVDLTEPQTRRFFAWQAFLAAHRACRAKDSAALDRALGDARRWLPGAPELAALADGDCSAKLRSPPPP
jgi:hypothetical protein